MTKTFRDLGVHDALSDALETQGITHPFPIQELTLPLALEGHDLIGQARTGTGKTLAFGLPLLQRLDASRAATQALVIVPTRELCLQVYEDLKIGAELGLTSISVYGGVGYDEQIDALTTGVHVVVGTPGRLLDHLNRGNLDLSNVTQLVLDEADEMLDMGFLPDVERLVGACQGEDRHTMLFSATMPTPIVKLARRYMDHPTFTRADYQEERETAPNVEQHFFQVHRMDKPRLLARILQDQDRGGVYVFVRTKHMADRLVTELEDLDTPAIAIHGDLRQATREKNLDRFRDGRATVLVATEVAARGLDVHGVTHVVNYDCPDDEKMYLHRIGRTARAGESGKAITFAEFNEVDRLNVIRKKIGATDAEVVQVFSTSALLAERFALPEERPWDRQVSAGRTQGGERGGRSSRGGDRSGGGGGRADAGRKGRSDGRPKGGRSHEGRGGDRDADRTRRDRSSEPARAAREAAPRGGAASTEGNAPQAGTAPRSPGSGGDRSRDDAPRGRGSGSRQGAPRDESPRERGSRQGGANDDAATGSATGTTRTRRRSRTRTAATPETTSGEGTSASTSRSNASRGSEQATGTTDRAQQDGGTTSQPAEASDRDAPRTRARSRGRDGAADRRTERSRGNASDSDGDHGGSSEDGSGGSGSRDRGARDRGDESRNRGRGGGGNRDSGGSSRSSGGNRDSGGSSRSSGGSRGSGGGSRNSGGGNRGSGGGSRGGDGGSRKRDTARRGSDADGRDRDPELATNVPTTTRGEAARGTGQPQRARRVRVDHLP